MLTESSENESINSDLNYVIRKIVSFAESVAFLEKLRLENPNTLIFGYLNINSIRNKFEMLTNMLMLISNMLTKMLINMPTSFKNPSNASCIDVMLTNHSRSFQNSLAVDTGLSDFHRMTVKVMKAYSPKLHPKLVNYRDFKKCSNEAFRDELLTNLCHSAPNYDDFIKLVNRVLDRHTTHKKSYIKANQKPFVTSELNKAIMNRSRLRNRYLKLHFSESKIVYTKQRNYTVNLLRKEKKIYDNNLDLNSMIDNKQFWRNVKPLLLDKISKSSKITVMNNNRIVSDDRNL